jgi:hypothetical protein
MLSKAFLGFGFKSRRKPQNPGTAKLGQRRYGGVEVQERMNLKASLFSGEFGAEDPRVRGELKDERGGRKP